MTGLRLTKHVTVIITVISAWAQCSIFSVAFNPGMQTLGETHCSVLTPFLITCGAMPSNKPGLGHHYTKYLTKPCHNTNQNVTADNWLTSVPRAYTLKNCGMTLIGTIKCLKKEIPACINEKESRNLGNTVFLYTKEMTLIPCAPQKSHSKDSVAVLHQTPRW